MMLTGMMLVLLPVKPPQLSRHNNVETSGRLITVVKAKCGFLGVLDIALFPDFRACSRLCEDYAGKDSIDLVFNDDEE